MRSKKETRITSLCMPLPIRMGIAKGQWIYLLALAVEFGAVALVGKLGDIKASRRRFLRWPFRFSLPRWR